MLSTLYRDCQLVRPDRDFPVLEDAWLLERQGSILAVGTGATPDNEADEIVKLGGALVLPGLINAHSHLYSALAGRIHWPRPRPTAFTDILKQIWWPLDRALDEESIRVSARLGMADAIRHGCTTLIDHHSSPNCVGGSLAIILDVAYDLGIKIAVAYEVSDRDGPEVLEAAIRENLDAAAFSKDSIYQAALFGLHASFTLSDLSLARCAEATPDPFHIHCAEAPNDLDDARDRGYESVVARLEKLDILRPGTVLAHGIHLAPDDPARIRDRGSMVVHCPRSNAHNQVGAADLALLEANRLRPALGSDGFMGSMFAEADASAVGSARLPASPGATMLFDNNAELASSVFNRPIGVLEAGQDADFIVLPATESDPGPSTLPLRVVSRGKTVAENGVITAFDDDQLMADADLQAKRIQGKLLADGKR